MHANLCFRVGFMGALNVRHLAPELCEEASYSEITLWWVAHWLARSENRITCAVLEQLIFMSAER